MQPETKGGSARQKSAPALLRCARPSAAPPANLTTYSKPNAHLPAPTAMSLPPLAASRTRQSGTFAQHALSATLPTGSSLHRRGEAADAAAAPPAPAPQRRRRRSRPVRLPRTTWLETGSGLYPLPTEARVAAERKRRAVEAASAAQYKAEMDELKARWDAEKASKAAAAATAAEPPATAPAPVQAPSVLSNRGGRARTTLPGRKSRGGGGGGGPTNIHARTLQKVLFHWPTVAKAFRCTDGPPPTWSTTPDAMPLPPTFTRGPPSMLKLEQLYVKRTLPSRPLLLLLGRATAASATFALPPTVLPLLLHYSWTLPF